METTGKFYLGRHVDPTNHEVTERRLLYDPDDLMTHAVVVGMTGSGKTGLCIDLLEEAALNNVPAFMIDPKGDITNAVLHFPELAAADFEPWINAAAVQREGKTTGEAAAETAERWRNGLASWDIGRERIQALKDSVQFSIYTPGSDAGLPLSILATLKAPDLPWQGNEEHLREQIGSTVTAVLGLVGLKDIDPVRSREHILLANIFEHNWSQGKNLDLAELILQTQSPPFEKLGVFDVNTFFPESDRFGLSMQLNNILAAPTFQSWIKGEPLDVEQLLYLPDGRPRHTIFYIAHLNDDERMFFVTLLYSAVEAWMRAKSGTTSLRAIVYFDEIFGYLPPVGNPPSKGPMLRLLKQARAFGVSMVLATQNPVDVDYKALSNAGSWFIGKLGTEQDKERLLDGLATAASGGLDRRQYDQLISALGKRVFLLRNVHEKQPQIFNTRWAMNYLAGPITRTKIPALNELAGAEAPVETAIPGATAPTTTTGAAATPPTSGIPATAEPAAPELPGSETKPAVPRGVGEYFLTNTLTLSEAARVDGRSLPSEVKERAILYRPVLLAQAQYRILNRKYDLNFDGRRAALLPEPDERGLIRWEGYEIRPIDSRELDRGPVPDGRFVSLDPPLSESRPVKRFESDFVDWLYHNTEIEVKANEELEVYGGPEMSEEEFEVACRKAAEVAMEAESEKVADSYDKKLDRLEDKLDREERELEDDKAEYSQRKQQEVVSHAETLFSLFSKRRRSLSSSMSKRRMTAKAKADVEESEEEIEELTKEIEEMEAEAEAALLEVKTKWEEIAAETTTIPVTPYKKDISVELFGVAWLPYLVVEEDGRFLEFAGYAVGVSNASMTRNSRSSLSI